LWLEFDLLGFGLLGFGLWLEFGLLWLGRQFGQTYQKTHLPQLVVSSPH